METLDVTVLKEAHRELIDQNPRDVLLHRDRTVADDDGGKGKESAFVGLLHGRLYQSSSVRQPNQQSVSDAGLREEDSTWGFITEALMTDVDPDTGVPVLVEGVPQLIPTSLEAGPQVDDQFETEFGIFHVTAVHPRQTAGELWGWDAIVEVRR